MNIQNFRRTLAKMNYSQKCKNTYGCKDEGLFKKIKIE